LKHTVDSPLEEGLVLTIDELAAAARSVREEAGDRQEDTAAKLNVGQAQISRAENGSKSHSSTCIEMIELYTTCRVEHPLFRITRAEE
jgi:transcriptional regulator with XRE-family HTH domain